GFFLSHLEGQHELHGVKNLVHKERDRLKEVIELLNHFEKKSSTEGDVLYIEESPGLINKEIELDLPDDHRMVMAGALFLSHHQGGSLKPAEAVKKSYPDFFSLLSKT